VTDPSLPREQATGAIAKQPTRIAGFDAMSGGGLPAAGATLVLGEAGTGKTVFACNVVANALAAGETCLFVAFEETPDELLTHARSFDWDLESHVGDRLLFFYARPPDDAASAGEFDLEGLIAALRAHCGRSAPAWIVLDGIDQLLSLLPGRRAPLQELRRLNGWLKDNGRASLLTAKPPPEGLASADPLLGAHYMVSTVVELSSMLEESRLVRKLRIAKYRGSAHVTDEMPMVIDGRGISLPYKAPEAPEAPAGESGDARVSTGVPRLDTLLEGGYFAGSSVLVSGAPGTSKTTLAGAFAAATAARSGERTLFVSFDELPRHIVRNLRSVAIDLETPRADGRLVLVGRRAWEAPVESHFLDMGARF